MARRKFSGLPRHIDEEVTRRAQRNLDLALARAGRSCPVWARTPAFRALFLRIYKRSAIKTYFKKGGQACHVDHIVPLKGDNVCGLTVPWNLHVIYAAVNVAKGTMIVSEWLNKDMLKEAAERKELSRVRQVEEKEYWIGVRQEKKRRRKVKRRIKRQGSSPLDVLFR